MHRRQRWQDGDKPPAPAPTAAEVADAAEVTVADAAEVTVAADVETDDAHATELPAAVDTATTDDHEHAGPRSRPRR
ncbi:MAG: hypothetical protein R3C56_22515 [Pirellulaceae bacterium]